MNKEHVSRLLSTDSNKAQAAGGSRRYDLHDDTSMLYIASLPQVDQGGPGCAD